MKKTAKKRNKSILLLILLVPFCLSIWQVKRMFWKQEILQQFEQNCAQEPKKFDNSYLGKKNICQKFTSCFRLDDDEFYALLTRKDKIFGYQIIAKVKRCAHEDEKFFLNLGYVDDIGNLDIPNEFETNFFIKEVKNNFMTKFIMPKSEMDRNLIYYHDMENINRGDIYNNKFIFENSVDIGNFSGKKEIIKPHNRHLGYAITWGLLFLFGSIIFIRI